MQALTYQTEDVDPEIRQLSLETLIDSPLLAKTALAWTTAAWLWALIVSGWVWILIFLLADFLLFSVRRKMLTSAISKEGDPGSLPAIRLATSNLCLIALASAEALVLTQISNERAPVLAIFLTLAFTSYVVAFFAAFPILARVNILMLGAGLGGGLLIGPSEIMRPFGFIVPGGTLLYWIMIDRMHVRLLGALRDQHASRLLSLHDSLTKLPNRSFMRQALERYLTADDPKRDSPGVAVLCLDLDEFKQVNDRFGHAAGDCVLIHVADILRRALTRDEVACRIGGDEYVVLLPGADQTRVRGFSQTVIEAMAQPVDIGHSQSITIGVSIGAVIAKGEPRSLEAVLKEADAALYVSKRMGRGRLHISSVPSAQDSRQSAWDA